VLVLGAARQPNREQRACLAHDPASPLLIVAGPGSGKTMVLVLRALRHVLVDHVCPEQIMITTFTRKAAKEIRTRLIEWGTPPKPRLKRTMMAPRRLSSGYGNLTRRLVPSRCGR